ncbi:MAG TPA: hypothetical protein VGE98_03970 [Thermoanaerobaculia bacterium]
MASQIATLSAPRRSSRPFLALRLAAAGVLVAAALSLAPRPVVGSTLDPVCAAQCRTQSNGCVAFCNGVTSCVQNCRTAYEACLSHCVTP